MGSGETRDPRAAAFGSASAVFAGRVRWVSASLDAGPGERSYGMRVTEVWKGEARDSVTIVREKPGPCPLPLLALGSEYVVCAARDSAGPVHHALLAPGAGDGGRAGVPAHPLANGERAGGPAKIGG